MAFSFCSVWSTKSGGSQLRYESLWVSFLWMILILPLDFMVLSLCHGWCVIWKKLCLKSDIILIRCSSLILLINEFDKAPIFNLLCITCLFWQARDLLKIFKIKPTTFINYMTSVEVRNWLYTIMLTFVLLLFSRWLKFFGRCFCYTNLAIFVIAFHKYCKMLFLQKVLTLKMSFSS